MSAGEPRTVLDMLRDAHPEWHDAQRGPSAFQTQVAGDHYKTMAIQPVEFIHKNGIGYMAGNVIKYVVRYRDKNGTEDLKKARHYLDLLIEMEEKP